ncbi:hypothetical protein [Mycobacteroides abscessus]|uniref:hypothetical protein n=1 Tax=Mycobacteroides abscessus TaxID=36809 RepID=UPI001F46A826|nr:hypothetical protein [Mycobacteroides abscessus]
MSHIAMVLLTGPQQAMNDAQGTMNSLRKDRTNMKVSVRMLDKRTVYTVWGDPGDIKKHFVQYCPECTKHRQLWCQHVGPGFSVGELKITECTITPEPPKPSTTTQSAGSGDNEFAQAMDLMLKMTGLSMQALNSG